MTIPSIALKPVGPDELLEFKHRLQVAFTPEEGGNYPGEDGGLFKFEKNISR